MRKQVKEGSKIFNIDRYRILAGLSQNELADLCQISRGKFSTVESFTHEELAKIAEVLEVSEADLLCDKA